MRGKTDKTERQQYWRLERNPSAKWHLGNTETSAWCGVETSGASFVAETAVPDSGRICQSCTYQHQVSNAPKYAELRKVAKREEENFCKSNEFLASYEWRKLRMEVIKHYGRICMCCRSDTNPIQVDHIKPRRKHPELALTFDNLQILCDECNHGKGNWDETDWRPKEEDHLPDGALDHMKDILRH